MQTILKVLVGSRGHGLENCDSDYDYRSCFVQNTKLILGLQGFTKFSNKDDNTQWEVQKFLTECLKCNPNVLEVLNAPAIDITDEGYELQKLFIHIINKRGIYNAFTGFAKSQKSQALSREVPPKRINKFLCHYLRVLYSGLELLESGVLPVNVKDRPWGRICRDAKDGKFELAEGLELGKQLELKLQHSLETTKIPDNANIMAVEQYLLNVRLNHLRT